tara:strand:- start:397 stop:600 length:204 start_codon:yes stop_codon:yes gene_type:complete
MKVGDLVIMPGETLRAGDSMSIGIIVEEKDSRMHSRHWKRKRVGVMWTDGGGVIDYEPKDWLEVVNG